MRLLPIDSSTKCLNARDICLLEQIFFIHIVFVIGWEPSTLKPIEKEKNIDLYLFFRLMPKLGDHVLNENYFQ